jgi:hypothetical protein
MNRCKIMIRSNRTMDCKQKDNRHCSSSRRKCNNHNRN